MCAVSAVGDYWRDTLPSKPYYPGISPWAVPGAGPQPEPSTISRSEFEALKRDVEELKQLLLAAKKFDTAVGEPDCEMDEKVALIKRLAQLVGVPMNEVFGG